MLTNVNNKISASTSVESRTRVPESAPSAATGVIAHRECRKQNRRLQGRSRQGKHQPRRAIAQP